MKKKVPLAIKIDGELLKRLDAMRDAQKFETSRTALIEAAIEQMLEREKGRK